MKDVFMGINMICNIGLQIYKNQAKKYNLLACNLGYA